MQPEKTSNCDLKGLKLESKADEGERARERRRGGDGGDGSGERDARLGRVGIIMARDNRDLNE